MSELMERKIIRLKFKKNYRVDGMSFSDITIRRYEKV